MRFRFMDSAQVVVKKEENEEIAGVS